ncbi:MAG: cytochrome b [Gammaproteobacteria bacterium]|nr:cytochrome b [Gammaproteobacteria bacterium]
MPQAQYRPPQIALHWLSALLILSSIALGLSMVELDFSPQKLRWYSWHKWLGITILLLSTLRLGARWAWGAPPALPMPRWQARAATGVHLALYVLLLAIPLSGWAYSSASGVPVVYLGLLPLPNWVPTDKALAEVLKLVHKSLNYTLFVLLAAHIGAALKHQFIDRDGLLRRMWPARSAKES